ncbi:hypothetical protein PC39_02215 [Salinisphaera sp. PC39]|uniref:tetratricopeptide repeat protein n=1 Tax=Salinisphaera sp. PC39 TaxID=1304156 RepID=UPI00333FEC07
MPMKVRATLALLATMTAAMMATVACYAVGLNGPFILDDVANIALSRVDSLNPDEWIRAITGNYSGRLGRPVAAASFAVTTYFADLDPWAFKVGNLVLHLACGGLFCLLGMSILRALPRDRLRINRVWIVAALAAALWLLHPLNVSTTLYAVQRMAQLSTFFVLIALCAYAGLRPRLDHRPCLTATAMIGAVAVAGVLGVLSKENAALLPVYLLLLETGVFRWHTRTSGARYALTGVQGVLVIAPLTMAALYVATHFDGLTQSYQGRPFSLQERLLTEANALWHYLRVILVPDINQMSLFQDGYPIQRTFDAKTALAIGGHAVLLLSAAILYRRQPVYSLGVGVFYTAHLLESTFLPLEPVFEHRNYLAAWGPLLILSYYGTRAIHHQASKPALLRLLLIFGCLLSLYAYITHNRAYIWADVNRIYLHALRHQPHSARALTNYANGYLQGGDTAQGRRMLLKAIGESETRAIGPVLQLTSTYCGSGAIPPDLYRETLARLRHGPADSYARNALYHVIKLQAMERCPELSVAQLIDMTRAFLINPTNSGGNARYHALMHYARALSLDGRHDETIRLLWRANTMCDRVPNHAKSLALQGITLQYLRMGRPHEAHKALRRLARLTADPRIPAKPRMWPYLSRLKDMSMAERYQLVDLSEFHTSSEHVDRGQSPSPADL